MDRSHGNRAGISLTHPDAFPPWRAAGRFQLHVFRYLLTHRRRPLARIAARPVVVSRKTVESVSSGAEPTQAFGFGRETKPCTGYGSRVFSGLRSSIAWATRCGRTRQEQACLRVEDVVEQTHSESRCCGSSSSADKIGEAEGKVAGGMTAIQGWTGPPAMTNGRGKTA